MGYFDDVYLRRVNRFGSTYGDRVQGQREHEFQNYLKRSIYVTTIEVDGETIECSFEPYSQDETSAFAYLLVPVNVMLRAGAIYRITDYNGEANDWMVFYLEKMKASGYNRYIMLRMSHTVEWTDREGNRQRSQVYLNGKQNSSLKNTSKSTTPVLYSENMNESYFTMPLNPKLRLDDYIEIGEGDLKECFVVTGFDRLSVEGVEFVTLDPVYERDLTEPPLQQPTDDDDEFFWLDGGEE